MNNAPVNRFNTISQLVDHITTQMGDILKTKVQNLLSQTGCKVSQILEYLIIWAPYAASLAIGQVDWKMWLSIATITTLAFAPYFMTHLMDTSSHIDHAE